MKLVDVVHTLLKAQLSAGDIAIDATVGNGHDTLFLARLVSPAGTIYGFDIQEDALNTAMEKCRQAQVNECLNFIHASHEDMKAHIPSTHHGKIKVCLFNLGYLPGGDKRIITQATSTLAALDSACQLLAGQGTLTVLAYPGHAGGETEAACVEHWCRQLGNDNFKVEIHLSEVHKSSAPRLFVIHKLKDAH